MISSPNIERNIELNFPLEKVKQDIERTVKNGAYAMHSKNDVLNTYRIGKLTGLESISMNVTLKGPENGNTNIHIVVTEKIRNNGHQITIDQMIDAFLERLSKALTGATDEELKNIPYVEHVWVSGDRLYKLSQKYYGNTKDWWIILNFNKLGSEVSIKQGDIIKIPQNIQETLVYFI